MWLIRDHGDQAEDVLEEKLRRRDSSRSMREVYRLTRGELRRLRRRRGEPVRGRGIWGLAREKLAGLFRRDRRRSRKAR